MLDARSCSRLSCSYAFSWSYTHLVGEPAPADVGVAQSDDHARASDGLGLRPEGGVGVCVLVLGLLLAFRHQPPGPWAPWTWRAPASVPPWHANALPGALAAGWKKMGSCGRSCWDTTPGATLACPKGEVVPTQGVPATPTAGMGSWLGHGPGQARGPEGCFIDLSAVAALAVTSMAALVVTTVPALNVCTLVGGGGAVAIGTRGAKCFCIPDGAGGRCPAGT
jgi:hypothetical protein